MVKEKTENILDSKTLDEKILDSNDELLKLAFQKAIEKKIPIILWEKKDEGKEYLFQIISRDNAIITAFMIGANGKKSEVQFQIKPSALNTQIMKLGINENSIFAIKYLGLKKQSSNSEFEFKSFIVRKFDPVTQLFYTSKSIE